MRDFLKYTLATLVGLAAFTTLSVAGFIGLIIILIASSAQETEPQVKGDSILTFDLSQPITDSPPATRPGQVVETVLSGSGSNRPMSLRSVVETIEQAAEDDRIVGLYIHGSSSSVGLGSGFATLREVRQALQTFRDSGKPVYAFDGESWEEKDYYLASVADTVVQHPGGVIEINGFNAENIFFADALQKYGVGVQILRVGQYKSAIEPFTRNSNSPEEEQQTQKLLTDLWSEFLATTAESREVTPQSLQAIADQQALLLPTQAEASGLIDRVAYEDELITELQDLAASDEDTDSFRQVSLLDYSQGITSAPSGFGTNQIAVIYAEGEIVTGSGGIGSIGGESLVEILREVRKDEDIKAVVLRVNSPGGSATASEQIAREVWLTTQEKPVIVSMGDFAASGGYQISTYANQIFASPGTITGSIGVFGLLPNFQQIANNNGITWDSVKTGRYADLGTVSRPKTPEELAIAQRVVDRIYDQFLTIVSESRDLPKERVAEVAQGRVWSGTEAEKIGLVDELGGLEDAIQAAAEAANLGDNWQLEEYPQYPSFWLDAFSSRFATQTATQTIPPTDPVSLELKKLQADLETLQSMNDPMGVYGRLPFNLRIR